MNIVIVTLGSYGDVHPFVGIGSRLLRRGHRVIVVANPHFEPIIRAENLAFEPIGTAEEYHELTRDRDLWSKRRAFKVVFSSVVRLLEPVYAAMIKHIDRDTVVVASSLALAARVARDEMNFPLVTVHLAPAVLRSVYHVPKLPGLFMPRWMPLSWKRSIWDTGDRWVVDPVICPMLNDFRAKKNLPPVQHVLRDWWNSPDRVIGMFPDWFGPVQPDWPGNMRLTGFPLYDERGVQPLPQKLEEFLCAGEAPVAFTPGSAMVHGHEFFDVAVEACLRTGHRGVLLSRYDEHVPPNLPKNVIHIPFAPFSELLPRVAAVVHHGGIGSSAQALAAGTPQLVMPMAHDQFDNGDRLRKLGVAEVVHESRFSIRRATRAIRALVDDPSRKLRCREIASRFKGVDALAETCDLIEQLAPPNATARSTPAEAPCRGKSPSP